MLNINASLKYSKSSMELGYSKRQVCDLMLFTTLFARITSSPNSNSCMSVLKERSIHQGRDFLNTSKVSEHSQGSAD